MMMKLFAFLCLLSVMQNAWSLPVTLDDIKDNLVTCGVEWTDDSLACVKGMATSTDLTGIDISDVADTLAMCGFSWDTNSAKCLSKWLPNTTR